MPSILASLGYDLIVAARSTDKLYELRDEIKNVDVRVITIDLSREQDSYDLYEHLKEEKIDFLVNNAASPPTENSTMVVLDTEIKLIHTNIVAVHVLTKLFLKDMISRNSGHILNVGSSAGFLPGPTFAGYYASKNYVVRLTEAIHEELRRDKVNVGISVLCPGPVKTNFNDVANVKFCIRGLSAEYVAKYAVDKTLKNKMIIIPGFEMKALKFLQHFVGEKTLTKISYNVQIKKN